MVRALDLQVEMLLRPRFVDAPSLSRKPPPRSAGIEERNFDFILPISPSLHRIGLY